MSDQPNPPAERPTPITDANEMVLTKGGFFPKLILRYVKPDVARDLERQLAEAREQRDRLAEALELGIQLEETGNIWSVRPDKFQAFLKSAKAALRAVKGGGK